MSETHDLVRRALIVTDDLDLRGYKHAGPIRQLARRAVELEAALRAVRPDPDGCPICGDPIEQPEHGRRRDVCSNRCRATKWRRNAKVNP